MTKAVVLNPYPFGSLYSEANFINQSWRRSGAMVSRTCLSRGGHVFIHRQHLGEPTRGWSDANRQYRYACTNGSSRRACPNGPTRRACPNQPHAERRFNGKENRTFAALRFSRDFETTNDDFTIAIGIGARILDTRMGRWLSLDFKSMNSLWYNPYNYVGNKPIVFIDTHGYEKSKSVAYFDFVVIIVTAEQLAISFNTQPGIIQDNNTMVVYTNNISEANKLISDYETLKNQNRSFSNIKMKVHDSVENNNSKLDFEKKEQIGEKDS